MLWQTIIRQGTKPRFWAFRHRQCSQPDPPCAAAVPKIRQLANEGQRDRGDTPTEHRTQGLTLLKLTLAKLTLILAKPAPLSYRTRVSPKSRQVGALHKDGTHFGVRGLVIALDFPRPIEANSAWGNRLFYRSWFRQFSERLCPRRSMQPSISDSRPMMPSPYTPSCFPSYSGAGDRGLRSSAWSLLVEAHLARTSGSIRHCQGWT